jgi:hypothetical protein
MKTDEEYVQGEAEGDAQLAWELFEVTCLYTLRNTVDPVCTVQHVHLCMYCRETTCPASIQPFSEY